MLYNQTSGKTIEGKHALLGRTNKALRLHDGNRWTGMTPCFLPLIINRSHYILLCFLNRIKASLFPQCPTERAQSSVFLFSLTLRPRSSGKCRRSSSQRMAKIPIKQASCVRLFAFYRC